MKRSRSKLKLPLAVAGALAVGELGVLLLRPDVRLKPVAVSASRYFTPSQLERANQFTTGQRWLALGSLALEGAVLVLLVVRPPRRALALAERLARGRRLAAGALVGAGLVVVLAVATFPLNAIAHHRAVDVGLATQSFAEWSIDQAKSTGIAAAFAAAGGMIALVLMRRFPRRWWLPGAGVVVAVAVLFVWLAPVLLDPLFNRYTQLREGRTRSELLALARQAGVKIGNVYVVDASRRTRAANAYVAGIGRTKRIVVYDTLLERFSPAQTRLVVAHELGHVSDRDILRGLAWIAISAPAAMLVVALLSERWARRAGAVPGSPAALPALALALALVSLGGAVVSNQLSRRIEAHADQFALDHTGASRQFIALERRLAVANVADPEPPAVLAWLFGTHPTTLQRIGAALDYGSARLSSSR